MGMLNAEMPEMEWEHLSLPSLSLSKVLENGAFESEQLFRACRETGFFLLNLTGSSAGETMLDDAENVFRSGRRRQRRKLWLVTACPEA